MTKQKRHIGAERHKKKECYSSSSESCSESSYSDSDSESMYDSVTSCSTISDHSISDAESETSMISVDKDKRSRDFRKLHNTRSTRGKSRSHKKSSVVDFVSMAKEILKAWDKGGYITSDFLNKLVCTYKMLLARHLELTRVDTTKHCSCSIEDATYIVALAFCMHYNACGEDSEKWKIRFYGLTKNLISKNLITLEIVSDIFPLDASGNYYVDLSSNKIIISGVKDDETGKILYTDVAGADIIKSYNGLSNTQLGIQLPGLKDLAIVLETERALSTNMTLISKKITSFIDKNVYND